MMADARSDAPTILPTIPSNLFAPCEAANSPKTKNGFIERNLRLGPISNGLDQIHLRDAQMRFTEKYIYDLRDVSVEQFCQKIVSFLAKRTPTSLEPLFNLFNNKKAKHPSLITDSQLLSLKTAIATELNHKFHEIVIQFQNDVFDLCAVPLPTKEQEDHAKELAQKDLQKMRGFISFQKELGDLYERASAKQAQNSALDRLNAKLDAEIAAYEKLKSTLEQNFRHVTHESQKRKAEYVDEAITQLGHVERAMKKQRTGK